MVFGFYWRQLGQRSDTQHYLFVHLCIEILIVGTNIGLFLLFLDFHQVFHEAFVALNASFLSFKLKFLIFCLHLLVLEVKQHPFSDFVFLMLLVCELLVFFGFIDLINFL